MAPNKTRQKKGSAKLKVPIKDANLLSARAPSTLDQDVITKKLGYTPRPFQMQAINAQLNGKDTVVHAGTGAGKTLIAAGPHYHHLVAGKGKITIMVSPLLALQNEQVQTFKNEFGLKAVAVNSTLGSYKRETLEAIKHGQFEIVLISPELLLSKIFVDDMLRKPSFTSRVLSVVVDEAHVVSHWGSGFRKKYGELGMLRAFLPRGTPMVAMSATLPTRVRHDILQKLEYPKDDYIFVNIGNDRPNVALIVRAMEYSQESYRDLDFIIPTVLARPDLISSTMLYADNVQRGPEIIDYLINLLPEQMRNAGLVRPFSAGFHLEYREEVLALFKEGSIRVLVCTDAAGMGCNLPAVDVVVQWKLPTSLSSFIQRAGRAARSPTLTGRAVLLVERTAYATNTNDLDTAVHQIGSKKKAAGLKATAKENSGPKAKDIRSKKDIKLLAEARGMLRGTHKGKHDLLSQDPLEVVPNPDAPDEGLLAFVLTTCCRRRVVTRVYNNVILEKPSGLCCDICAPSLLEKTRPGPPLPKSRQTNIKKEHMCCDLQSAIFKWRSQVHARDYPDAMHSPSAILPDSLVETLSSIGPITEDSLCRVLQHRWLLYSQYKTELLAVAQAVPLSSFSTSVGTDGNLKRKVDHGMVGMNPVVDVGCDGEEGKKAKRVRVGCDSSKTLFTPASQPCQLPSSVAIPASFLTLPPTSTPRKSVLTSSFNYNTPTIPYSSTPVSYPSTPMTMSYASMCYQTPSSSYSTPSLSYSSSPMPFYYSSHPSQYHPYMPATSTNQQTSSSQLQFIPQPNSGRNITAMGPPLSPAFNPSTPTSDQ